MLKLHWRAPITLAFVLILIQEPMGVAVRLADRLAAQPEPQTPATPDQRRIAAQRAFSEAEAQRAQGTAAALETAIAKYQEALRLWRAMDDRRAAGYTLSGLGKSYASLGEAPRALDYFQQALPLFRAANDRRGEAVTLGDLGAVYYSLGELPKALEHYHQSLPLLREAGDRAGAAAALGNLGAVYASSGEPRQALAHYRQALTLWRETGDRGGEATALGNLGAAYSSLGELRQALDYHHQALALWRELGDPRRIAPTLNNLGLVYSSLGETERALAHYHQALALWREAGDRRGEAYALGGIGAVYASLGELQQVLDYYHQALALWRAVGDRAGRASTLSGIGKAYFALGETEQALRVYAEALQLWREAGDRRGEAYTLKDLGAAHLALQDQSLALDYYQEALPLLRHVGDRRGEADVLAGLGAVSAAWGETQGGEAYHRARDYYGQALQLWQKAGDRRGEAYARHAIGDVHYALGEFESAFGHNSQALRLFRLVRDQRGEVATLYSLARVEFGRSNLDQARASIEAALGLFESLRIKVASQELRASYLATMRGYYEFYIALLMRLHQLQPAAGHQAAALEASERARARALLEMLTEAQVDLRQGMDPALLARARALQQQLNAKAAAQISLLSDQNTEAQASVIAQELSALTAEYHQVQARIRTASPRYAALTQPQPLKLAEIQQLLGADTVLLEYALGEERSYLWAVTPTSIESSELPKRAEVEAAALGLYELLTAHHRRETEETEETNQRTRPAQPEAPSEQRGIGLPARAEREYLKAASELSHMLLEPVATLLRGKRLVIVADGALQYVPFAALPIPKDEGRKVKDEEERDHSILHPSSFIPHPLVVEHEIVSLPSASTLAVLRRELAGRQPAAKTLAVLADPVFDRADARVRVALTRAEEETGTSAPGIEARRSRRFVEKFAQRSSAGRIPRLPFTRQEAEAICALAPQEGRLLALDFEASRALAVSAELGQYRYLHFATHGLLDGEHPELSSLVLSLVDKQGAPQDGFLRTHEVYNLRLSAEVVVLSACETGLGKAVWGEGLVGLTRGFMYAGAARVVVSLWSVNDRATAELMVRFYRKLLAEGLRPAAALRATQVEMWKQKQWGAPFYWAAFILQGEWR